MPSRSRKSFDFSASKTRTRRGFSTGCIVLLFILAPFLLVYQKFCSSPPSSDPRVKHLESFTKAKHPWQVLAIPVGLSKQELIALGRDIHQRNPRTSFHLVDTDLHYKAFVNWVDEPWEYPEPAEFVRTHYVATIDNPYDNALSSFKWRLLGGLRQVNKNSVEATSIIADLE